MVGRKGLVVAVFVSLVLVAAGCGKKNKATTVVVTDGARTETQPQAAVETDRVWERALTDLKGKTNERRGSAIRDISQYEAATAIPAVLAVLDDKGYTEGAGIIGEPNSSREAAILALNKLGPEGEKAAVEKGLPVLTNALKDPNPGVREHAILAIGLLGSKASNMSGDLLKAGADPADNVRRAAYDALLKIGALKPAPLIPLLSNADAKVAYDAARNLNLLQPLPKEILPGLIDVLKKPTAEKEPVEAALTRLEVAEALASFGKDAEPAVPALMGVLDATTEEEFVKFYRRRAGRAAEESPAMMALRKIGQPAVAPLVEALNSDKNFVRWEATQVLAGMGTDAKEALLALQTAFDKEFERKDANFNVMSASAIAVVQLGGEPEPVVAKLSTLLENPNEVIRLETLRTLARLGRKGQGSLKAVLRAMDDLEKTVQVQAVETILAFGPAAKEAVPALGAKLADPEFNVRRGAVAALRSLGPMSAPATPELVKLLAEPDDALRREAIGALIAIGPGAKAAGPELAKLINASDERERALAVEAVAAVGADPKAVSGDLVKALNAKDYETRVAAAKSLGRIGDSSPETVAALAGKLKDGNMRVRIASAHALALLGPSAKAAAKDVQEFAVGKTKNPDPVAGTWGAVALYKLGVNPDANLQTVLAALKDKSPSNKVARLTAMSAVDLLGASTSRVLPELIDSLNDRTPLSNFDKTPVRQKAVEAIGKMGSAASSAVPKLTLLLKVDDPALKTATIEALAQIGPSAAFAAAKLREIVRTDPAFAEMAQQAG